MEDQENVKVYPQNVKYKPFSFMPLSPSFSLLRMDKPRKVTRHYDISVFSSKLTLEPSFLFPYRKMVNVRAVQWKIVSPRSHSNNTYVDYILSQTCLFGKRIKFASLVNCTFISRHKSIYLFDTTILPSQLFNIFFNYRTLPKCPLYSLNGFLYSVSTTNATKTLFLIFKFYTRVQYSIHEEVLFSLCTKLD